MNTTGLPHSEDLGRVIENRRRRASEPDVHDSIEHVADGGRHYQPYDDADHFHLDVAVSHFSSFSRQCRYSCQMLERSGMDHDHDEAVGRMTSPQL
jgi:hypothetical protein